MIEYQKEGKLAIFTINRPEALGALTVQGNKELHDVFIDFRDDDELWVGIITGTGDKAFCSGVDIKDMLPFIRSALDKPWQIPVSILRGFDLWKPMIAALNGLTLGGGLELALACDIRIASENARFGLPEVKVGAFPGGGGTQRLPRLIPRGMAAEMLFTGKTIDAKEAYRIGLVNRVVTLDKLMVTAKEIAGSICEAGPVAVRAVKEAMVRGYNMGLEEGLRLEASLNTKVATSRDFDEGIRAFQEKRKPKFEGK
jgi:enoyl-CoA hydratase/carnithine racemase